MLTGQSSATPLEPTPALFTRLSTEPARSKISAKPRFTESSSATSSTTRSTSTPASADIAFNLVAFPTSRTVPYTSWPCRGEVDGGGAADAGVRAGDDGYGLMP